MMKSGVESYEVGWQRCFTCLPHAVTLLPPMMRGDAERVVSRLCTCTHSHIILKEHSDESMSPWVHESVIKLIHGTQNWILPFDWNIESHESHNVSHCSLTLSLSLERTLTVWEWEWNRWIVLLFPHQYFVPNWSRTKHGIWLKHRFTSHNVSHCTPKRERTLTGWEWESNRWIVSSFHLYFVPNWSRTKHGI